MQGQFECLFGRTRRGHLKTFGLEVVLQYLTDIQLVVYNKYFHKSSVCIWHQRYD